MMTAACLSVLHFLPLFFLLSFASKNREKEVKACYLRVCCLAKQTYIRNKKKRKKKENNRCIKF
jgi:hypothetical protein